MKNTLRETPGSEPLARKWGERIGRAWRHWDRFHRRIRHNRQVVSGLDWTREPDSADFYMHRANLIHSTIMGILPGIYARNPEIAVTPLHASRDLKLLCKTIETVTNRYLDDARLKQRAKATVRAALTCSFGVLKVMYQREIGSDPLIHARIQDVQDNLVRARGLAMRLKEEGASADDSRAGEVRQAYAAADERVEVAHAQGLVIDRVMTEHLLIDPSIAEFWDYEQADWMAQIVPMKKAVAEGLYGIRLDRATVYRAADSRAPSDSGRLFSGMPELTGDDAQICVLEIWDKQTQRVYTMAQGCDFWLRAPYSPPRAGERWYPFFLLPFQTVDGCFVGPSIVDLTERLQNEHNTARDRYNEHRDLIKPGYIASADINERTLKRFSDSELGEITLIDADGQSIQQAIMPKSFPPIDPAVYDTSQVRLDWEMVTGLQDAARASIVTPKTATEASILQQSLSGRIAEFRDQVEDYLQQIAQYTAEILIQELDEAQVEKIMGPHRRGFLPADTANGGVFPEEGVIELAYDWPQLSRDEVFGLVQLKIRAGTTGVPNDLEQQESWTKLLPVIQPLIGQIMQFQLQGINPAALISLLKETVLRFDDKLDLEAFVPNLQKPAAVQDAGGSPDGKAAGGATGDAQAARQGAQAAGAEDAMRQAQAVRTGQAAQDDRAGGLAQLLGMMQSVQPEQLAQWMQVLQGLPVQAAPSGSAGQAMPGAVSGEAQAGTDVLLPLLMWLAERAGAGPAGVNDGADSDGSEKDRAGRQGRP